MVDAFEEQHLKLEAEKAQGADPEDPDEYRALGGSGKGDISTYGQESNYTNGGSCA